MKRIKLLKPIESRLVIEVPPYHWSHRETPSQGPSHLFRQQWQAYFQECMADAGIVGIEPIRPGSSFVDAFAVVRHELMQRILRELLEGAGVPGFPDDDGRTDTGSAETISTLDGGYAILGADDELLEPQCCCSFSDLENWKRALQERPTNAKLWIGHPEAHINFIGEMVTIREGWSDDASVPPPSDVLELSMRVCELAEAVSRAESNRQEFAEILLGRVRELIVDDILTTRVTTELMGRE